MDLGLFDAISAGIVVLFGIGLTLWSFLCYYRTHKRYYLYIGFGVFLISFSYFVIPFSYLVTTTNENSEILLIGWATAPPAACLLAYMCVDIFYENWRKPVLLSIFGVLSIIYYIFLFGFTSESLIQYRGTKAILTGPALYIIYALYTILTVIQVGGFVKLRNRPETVQYHKKMSVLILGWLLLLTMSILDTISEDPVSVGIIRTFFCISLLMLFYGYSPE